MGASSDQKCEKCRHLTVENERCRCTHGAGAAVTVTMKPIAFAVRVALFRQVNPGLPSVHHDFGTLVNFWASIINSGEKIGR